MQISTNCGSRHPSASPGTLEIVYFSVLPHPFSPLGTCTLTNWGFGNEIWGLLSKTINIFYLLFFLTVSCSVGAIPIQKCLGKNRASSYQDQSQLPRWKSVRNLCYPLISRYCGGSPGPPPCKTVRLLRQTLRGELFPPSLLPWLQCITWKAKSPGLHFDRNAFP